MRIYTNVFDLARICPRRFWVAPYSDFKIGVKITEKGAPSAKDFVVKAGPTELIPDDDKVDGFTTYAVKSAGAGSVEYAIEVEGMPEKLKLVQITTDSTVFEVGGSGGGDVPADVATKTWVESQISDFVDEDALTAYAEKTDLTAYYAKSETSSAAELSGEFTAVSDRADSAYNLADGAY